MAALIAAVMVLLLGAALCLLPLPNPARAALGILSQLVATVLVWVPVAPVLAGGEVLVGELAWAYRWAPCGFAWTHWGPSFSPGRCR